MKLITAIIKPFKLDETCARPSPTWGRRPDRLEGQGLRSPEGHTELYRGRVPRSTSAEGGKLRSPPPTRTWKG